MNEDDKQACRMIVKMAEKYNEYDQETESEEAKLRLAIVDEQDKKLKQF